MALSFRTARRVWMGEQPPLTLLLSVLKTSDSFLGMVALFSLTCISLALVLWAHGYSKSNNFGALIAIPSFAFAGAIWSWVIHSALRDASSADVYSKDTQEEVFFISDGRRRSDLGFCALPIPNMQVGLPTLYVLLISPTVLGLFTFESDGARHSRFSTVYQALLVLVWTNAALGKSLGRPSIGGD
jgi:hypothetical protein